MAIFKSYLTHWSITIPFNASRSLPRMYKKTNVDVLPSRAMTISTRPQMSYFKVYEHVLPCQYIREFPGATLQNQEDNLKLHIKQYVPDDTSASQPGAVTIIGAHANGFPKELYEPLWEDLYMSLKGRGQALRGIWIADVASQGKSGELNEDKIGNDPSWSDHARDMLLMINHFRRDMPRPLVGIGHSMGGQNLVNLALIHPRLLSNLVLIDPVIQANFSNSPSATTNFARLSTFRRDIWPSRAEAAASFKKSKLYQSWDPRVLDRWITYGIRELPTATYPDVAAAATSSGSRPSNPPVTLATSKHQEVFSFLRPNFDGMNEKGELVLNRLTHPDLDPAQETVYPFYRSEPKQMFDNLPHLRPSTLYVFGGKSPLSTPEWRRQKMQQTGTGAGGSGGAAEGRVKEVVLERGGHLLPLEIVQEVADATGEWTAEELKRWRRLEKEWRDQWEAKSREERTMITEIWKEKMGGDPRGAGSEKL